MTFFNPNSEAPKGQGNPGDVADFMASLSINGNDQFLKQNKSSVEKHSGNVGLVSNMNPILAIFVLILQELELYF